MMGGMRGMRTKAHLPSAVKSPTDLSCGKLFPLAVWARHAGRHNVNAESISFCVDAFACCWSCRRSLSFKFRLFAGRNLESAGGGKLERRGELESCQHSQWRWSDCDI